MKITAMLGDAAKSLFSKPVTEKYPFERNEAPVRLRGLVRWDKDKCSGCTLCVKDCPAYALNLHVIDKKTKKFVMEYHVDRCTFCAQCVASCNQDSIEMDDTTWELAAFSRDGFVLHYGDEELVEQVLEDDV